MTVAQDTAAKRSDELSNEQIDAICKGREYLLFIDESISMNEEIAPGVTGWQYAMEFVGMAANAADHYDDNGIDVVLFGGQKPTRFESIKPGTIGEILPEGPTAMSTYLGVALDQEFERYFTGDQEKSLTAIVLTDGKASDRPVVEQALINAANAVNGDGAKVGVTFIQVGHDAGAKADLHHYDHTLKVEADIVASIYMDDLTRLLAQPYGINRILAGAVTD